MKRSLIKIPIYFLAVATLLSACLNGDPINTPPGASSHLMAMSFDPAALAHGGTALNSGMRYFGSGALTYPHSDLSDTATIGVTLQGGPTIGKDITVTLVADNTALLDNYASDSITYLPMPDSVFQFVTTTGVIKAGTATAEFKIIFHPAKVDLKKSFMLAVSATNDANIPNSSNHGHVYLHFIGNAIQGAYSYDFYRYNCQTGAAGCGLHSSSFTGHSATFAPLNAHSVIVDGTYFNGPKYKISFKDDGVTVSNYKVSFYNLDASLTAAGVSVASGPTIAEYETNVTVNGTTYTYVKGHPIFVVNFVGWNGSAYRNITDVYVKK
jgi:hypothetical protein